MFELLTSTPLPELIAWMMVAGISLAVTFLAWPLLRPRASRTPVVVDPVVAIVPDPARIRGLAGQWSANSRYLDGALARRDLVMRLHWRVDTNLGAIEHEIRWLWRDLQPILTLSQGAADSS